VHPSSPQKVALRAELSRRRRDRSADEVEDARAAIRSAVLARADASGWRCVAGYLPLRTEPGSAQLLAELAGRGVRVLVPVLLADRDLSWAEWDTERGVAGPGLGADALADADAVLVPALAVARDGTRLGRGGGSYDRALGRRRPGAPAAALVYEDELVEALPSDAWDVPVDAIVRPSGWREVDRG
jgi:5-formyltetrahydrofolate cyclo-ligase